MVDTRRSTAAKRPAAQQEEEEEGEKSSSPAPVPTDQSAEAGDGVAAAAQPAKRTKVASTETDEPKEAAADAEAAGAAAAGGVAGTLPDMAGLQALTGSLDKLETLLKSREAQSNPAGHKHGASSKDLTVKIKRDKDLSSSVIEMANKGLPAATSRRQEPWCRLISQYSVDLRIKKVKRGALLEIHDFKVVRVNGKVLDKVANVTLNGGDEIVFPSPMRHAYIFEQLKQEKSSTPTVISACSGIQKGQHSHFQDTHSHLSSKKPKISTFCFSKGRSPLMPNGESICFIKRAARCTELHAQGLGKGPITLGLMYATFLCIPRAA